jgi:hypothetical protein
LTPLPAKCGRDVTAFSALQQNHDDEEQANRNVNQRNQNEHE